MGLMAKKPAKNEKASASEPKHKENILERAVDVIEERFLEGAELATETTSAETNLALAALGAIEGPRDTEPEVEAKPADATREVETKPEDATEKPANARRKKR